jgi:hypothetical protein
MDIQKIVVAAVALVIIVGAVALLRWFERPAKDGEDQAAGKN